jgi:VanZ family protein
MVIIFRFSTANGEQSSGLSLNLTNQLVNKAAAMMNIELTPEQKLSIEESIHTPIRKLGHLTEYGLLGIAAAFALYVNHKKRGWNLILWCEGICVLYACTDEFHQLFVPERSGQILDVLIDSVGITLGLGFFCLVLFCRKKNKAKRESKARL